MPAKPVLVRMPGGNVLKVQPSAARVYVRRGGVLLDAASDLPAKSARKSEWAAVAADLGVPDHDKLTKDELVDTLTPDTEE